MNSRRDFFRGVGAGAAAWAALGAGHAATHADAAATSRSVPEPDVVRLSEHLAVYRGPINVGMVRDGS